jgi:hypothetical protein
MDVAGNCWLAFSSVDEALVAGDWDFNVALSKAAPELLDQCDNGCAYVFWCFRADIEVLLEEWSVRRFVVVYADEVGVAIGVR